MKLTNIVFEKILATSDQIDVLFRLLNERTHKISHSDDVDFYEHKRFVESHPYRAWFLVKHKEDFIGSFYLTNENTLGINIVNSSVNEIIGLIVNFVKSNFEPLPAIPSVRNGRFTINVPPTNVELIDSLTCLGSELAQLTYFLPK